MVKLLEDIVVQQNTFIFDKHEYIFALLVNLIVVCVFRLIWALKKSG
ncbi:hypothetical protein GNIT_3709 [Glaciecola nitratireducens FR1064]|uniref:Uncharacterized protein n=1 Tax=Glaciecola nitratireducens (strain JCM 12485 / KCTC 12276 / FR1064) TaxID=1085623 RepID=G4QNJ9_GLANF|nr:hypothetical protein GNIT_3709 [Glaciecola nitratireducens FR1064]